MNTRALTDRAVSAVDFAVLAAHEYYPPNAPLGFIAAAANVTHARAQASLEHLRRLGYIGDEPVAAGVLR